MALQLQYFQANVLGSYLIDAWQNQLQTEADPTSGEWFVNGPNNGLGLLGGLVDELATDLVFDKGQMSVNKTKEVAYTTTVDNRDGLLDAAAAAQTTMNWTITNSATATHTTSSSIKTGISEKLTVKSAFGIEDITSETTVSFEYSFSWTDTQANTLTDAKSFTEAVPLKVPAGKVYKVVVLADRDAVTIPYSAQVFLTGVSEANFAEPVSGKSNWSADAGTICSWINKYGSAGNDSMSFETDPTNPQRGVASLPGTMRANQAVNFTIYALDVTSSFNADQESTALINQLTSGSTPAGTVLVQPIQGTAPS
jgi:hypothetical protein